MMTWMRLHITAACTLAAIAAWDQAQATATPVPGSDPWLEPSSVNAEPEPANDVPAVAQLPPPQMDITQFPAIAATTQPPPIDGTNWPLPPASATPTAPSVPSVTAPAPIVPAQAPSVVNPAPIVPSTTPQPAAPINKTTAVPGSNNTSVLVTDIQVVGVDAELQSLVQRTVNTKPGTATNQAQLQADVAAILETGFFSSAMVSAVNNPVGVTVVYQVQPTILRSLQVTNAQALTPAVVNQIFANQIGQPLSPSGLNQSVRQINQWYAQNGYTLARVLTLQPNQDGTLGIDVAEGLISDIQVRFVNKDGKTVEENGQPVRYRSQIGFIRDNIKLQPGQIFQSTQAQQDIQRLYGLGTVDNVAVTFAGDARRATVIYNIVEGKARGFNFGGGYNDDVGIYGTVTYQDRNFAGLAQQIGGSVQVSGKDVLYDLNFRSPYRDIYPNTPGWGLNTFRRRGVSRVFDDRIRLANEDRVREREMGGGISAEKPLGPDWMGTLGLNYTQIRMTDKRGRVQKQDIQGNPLTWSGEGVDDLFTLTFTALRDLRDNPINPSTGSVLSLSTEQYLPIGRGSIAGNKLQANYSQFLPVNWLTTPQSRAERGTQQPEVVGLNVQTGTVLGDLPPHQAFTLGGANSVRGYDAGDLATSRSFFLASAEYRFPLYKIIGGAVFADFGSDLGTSDDVLGEPGVKRGKPGIGAGFGAGVRVNSPLGIVRLDFGVSTQGDTKLQFGFGHKF